MSDVGSAVHVRSRVTRRKEMPSMADDANNAQAQQQPPLPHPDLKNLDRLLGTWEMSGDG